MMHYLSNGSSGYSPIWACALSLKKHPIFTKKLDLLNFSFDYGVVIYVMVFVTKQYGTWCILDQMVQVDIRQSWVGTWPLKKSHDSAQLLQLWQSSERSDDYGTEKKYKNKY